MIGEKRGLWDSMGIVSLLINMKYTAFTSKKLEIN